MKAFVIITAAIFSIYISVLAALSLDSYSDYDCYHGVKERLQLVFPNKRLGCWLHEERP